MVKSIWLMFALLIVSIPFVLSNPLPLDFPQLYSLMRFNESDTSLLDHRGQSTWTYTAATSANHISSMLDYAKNWTSSTSTAGSYYTSNYDYRNITSGNNYTICAYFVFNGVPSSYNLFFANAADVSNAGLNMYLDPNRIPYIESGSTTSGVLSSADGCLAFPIGGNTSFCITVNATGVSAFQNGTFMCRDTTFTTSSAASGTATIARQYSGVTLAPYVLYDELAIFYPALNTAQLISVHQNWTSSDTGGGGGGDTIAPMSNLTVNTTSVKYGSVINISLNISEETALSYCWFYNNISNSNSTPIVISGTSAVCSNFTTITSTKGTVVNFIGYVNDTSNNLNFSTYNITISNTVPLHPKNMSWITTGGFTTTQLLYNQVLDYINATCIADVDNDLVGCNITVYDPDKTVVVNNINMSNISHYYSYADDITLNKAGDWNITIGAFDGATSTYNSTLISVTTQNQSTNDGWYGCSNNSIPNSALITRFFGYGCKLIEFNSSIQTIEGDMNNILIALNNSQDANIHVGLNFYIDFNYSNSTVIQQVKNNISAYFPTLSIVPYSAIIEYISLELFDLTQYGAAAKDGILNNLSNTITNAISNDYVVYSKNYNSSVLDAAYIEYTTMFYVQESTASGLVDRESNLMRTTTLLNRIYVGLNNSFMAQTMNFQDIITNLRAGPSAGMIINGSVAEMSNGDIVVFNNQTSERLMFINISNMSTDVSGKDVWDATKEIIIEANTDLLLNVNVSALSANLIFFEDLDHIVMDTNSQSTIYKATSSGQNNFNYSDGTNDGNWIIDGFADEIKWEGFDPFYKLNSFITYYGWINTSYIVNWSNYEIMILDDENPHEVAGLIANTTSTEFYFYISVADYDNTEAWQSSKETEVDNIIALNESTRIHIFVDGLDSGVGGSNFSVRFKELVDYVQVTKNRKAGLNTYTAYENFCQWADGFCMKESCVGRWNGASAANPDSYTREDWGLEINKSEWYNSHNIRVMCQAFHNRTKDTFEPLNWSEVQNMWYAAAVLGYDNYYISQPDFNYAQTIYLRDLGTDMAQSYSTDDNVTYYRRYSNGIVYYNSSSTVGWFDDGREIDVQVCFNLYDNSDGAGDEDMNWEFRVNNVSTTDSFQYSIPANTITAGVWARYCVKLNETHESPHGNYKIEAATTDAGTAADGIYIGWASYDRTGKHSWYSDTAGSPVWTVYPNNQNWEISIIVNETKKSSLDTFYNIQQQNSSAGWKTNITLSSNYSYPIEVWSNSITVPRFINLSYWNGTTEKKVNAVNTTTCDSNNPQFNSTTIDQSVHKACYMTSGSNVLVRISAPSLSDRSYILWTDSDTTSPVINSIQPANQTQQKNTTVIFRFNATEVNPDKATLYLNTTKWFYQEYANKSTIDIWEGNGLYAWTNTPWFLDEQHTRDGRWDRGGATVTDTASMYINYTKPEFASNNSYWMVKDEGTTVNLSIPTKCWDYNPETLMFRAESAYDFELNVTWYCFNSTSWQLLRYDTSGHNDIYEEAMWWKIMFVRNTTIAYNNEALTNITIILPEGDYLWNIQVNDTVSHTAWFSNNYTLTIDTTAPTITVISPANNSVYSSPSFVAEFNATDPRNISACRGFLNDLLIDINNSMQTNTVTYFKGVPLSTYENTLKIECNDTLNNVGNSTGYTIYYSVPSSTGGDTGSTEGGSSSNYPQNPNGTLAVPQNPDGTVNQTITSTGTVIRCEQKEDLLSRLKDNCTYLNGVCEDGETPISQKEDCKIDTMSLNCSGDRCIFKEIWFAKLLLVVMAYLIFSNKRDYSVIIAIIVLLLFVNFSTYGTTLLSETPSEHLETTGPELTQEQINSNLALKYGQRVYPSDPEKGFYIIIVLTVFTGYILLKRLR